MCFSEEQVNQLEAGNILVLFVYAPRDSSESESGYSVTGGYLTPDGLNSPETLFDMFAYLVSDVRASVWPQLIIAAHDGEDDGFTAAYADAYDDDLAEVAPDADGAGEDGFPALAGESGE